MHNTSIHFRLTHLLLSTFVLTSLVISSFAADAGDPFLQNDYALQLIQKGEPEKALEQLQRAYSLFPYNETLKRNLAEVFTEVGRKRMSVGRYEDAATSFDGARELYPENQRYSALRGIALFSARQYDAAIVELERARGLGKDSADILYFLGRAHYDSGNLPPAIEVWSKALELEPGRKELETALNKAKKELAVEGKMERGYSSRFVISYDGDQKSQLADKVLDELETAYNKVGSDLAFFPDLRMSVILYTKTDFRKVTESPDWSGGLYDGKIRLPVGGAAEINDNLRATLFHEYTHALVHQLTSGNCPIWLNEGLAEFEGRRLINQPLNQLEKSVKQGTVLPISTLEKSFISLSKQEASLAYEQSYSLVKYMIDTFGHHKVKEILLSLGTGKKISAAISGSLGELGIDYPTLFQEWQSSAQKEYLR